MSVSAYEVANRIAESTIKLLLTANGAAAIATLGFAGTLLGNGSEQVIDAPTLACSLILYALGVLCALLSMGALVAFLVFEGDPIIRHRRMSPALFKLARVLAWCFGILSGLLFIAGVMVSAINLSTYSG